MSVILDFFPFQQEHHRNICFRFKRSKLLKSLLDIIIKSFLFRLFNFFQTQMEFFFFKVSTFKKIILNSLYVVLMITL